MKWLSFLIVSLLLSCGSTKEKINVSSSDPRDILKAVLGDVNQESDEYTIMDARIEKNILVLSIRYSGGCTSTQGSLIGNQNIMKSMPPKRSMKFILKKEGACRKMNEEQFVIDIQDLAYKKEKGSEIILLLDGFDTPLKYIYN
ncbi:MAG: hypothetical protein KDC84_05465 [Crocinitomicaceae bacterium]|nr:hypothetical protein [Crocinitomicaceae bacterium]